MSEVTNTVKALAVGRKTTPPPTRKTNAEIYNPESTGSDETGDRKTDKPSNSVMQADDAEERRQNLEKKITIEEDCSLPRPIRIQIRDAKEKRFMRVKILGWIHHLRKQGNNLMFIILRDGTGYLQCVLSDKLCHSYDALTLATESSICVYGEIKELSEGTTVPGNHEMTVDYWELIGPSPPGEADNLLNTEAHVDVQLDNRHMMIRGEVVSKVLKLRSVVLQCIRDHYLSRGYFEVTPPTIMRSQVEEASQLFQLDYFGEKALLAGSSQMFLETCLPSMGNVFSIVSAYRSEQYRTRRHLAEFTHVEAECPFITFDDLLDRIEDLVCDVVERVLKSPLGYAVYELHPEYKVPSKPFKRMTYTDAITFLKENNITKEDGSFYEFGDDIHMTPERKMVDIINEPLMLCKFPAEISPFLMARCSDDRKLTESVDLLMPNVGETIGGAMRIWQYDELMEGFKTEGTDANNYYWYTDQRKYGSCPHGGYGLGLERFLCWLLNRHHITEVCLYPRFVGRCRP